MGWQPRARASRHHPAHRRWPESKRDYNLGNVARPGESVRSRLPRHGQAEVAILYTQGRPMGAGGKGETTMKPFVTMNVRAPEPVSTWRVT